MCPGQSRLIAPGFGVPINRDFNLSHSPLIPSTSSPTMVHVVLLSDLNQYLLFSPSQEEVEEETPIPPPSPQAIKAPLQHSIHVGVTTRSSALSPSKGQSSKGIDEALNSPCKSVESSEVTKLSTYTNVVNIKNNNKKKGQKPNSSNS